MFDAWFNMNEKTDEESRKNYYDETAWSINKKL